MRLKNRSVSTPDNVVLELIEQYFGAQGIRVMARGGQWYDGGSSGIGDVAGDAGFFNVNSGTVETATIFEGAGCYQLTGANATVNGRQMTNLLFPLGAQRTGLFLPMRYILEAELIRADPLEAEASLSFGFRRFNGVFGLFSSSPGVTVDSIETVNGGNWTVFHRVGEATSMQSLDTGIPGTTRALVRFDYTDSTDRELRVSINGSVVRTLSGVGVPALRDDFNEAFSGGFFQGDGTLDGTGQIDRVRRARYKVIALTGFPTDA
jgi:hypothetical protein